MSTTDPSGPAGSAGAGVRGAMVIASALTGLLLASCGDARSPGTGVPPPEQTASATSPASDQWSTASAAALVLVTADWTDDLPFASPYPDTLPTIAIRYTVRNDGPAPLLVAIERGHDQSPSSNAPPTAMAVWVSQGAESDLARLSKQVFDAPPDVDLAVPWRAPAELLDAGAEREGYVVVPIPLRGDLPSASDGLVLTEQELEGSPDRVEVCVQVVPFVVGMAPDEIIMGMPDGLACSDPLELDEGHR